VEIRARQTSFRSLCRAIVLKTCSAGSRSVLPALPQTNRQDRRHIRSTGSRSQVDPELAPALIWVIQIALLFSLQRHLISPATLALDISI
jgi:hypothetical protein